MFGLLAAGGLKIATLIITGICLAIGFGWGHKISHKLDAYVAERVEMRKVTKYRATYGHQDLGGEHTEPGSSFFQKLTEGRPGPATPAASTT